MVYPDLEDFQRVARRGSLVPVYREVLADLETPVSAYMKIAKDQPHSFLLESVERADSIGRYSFLGANPSTLFRSKGRTVTITRDGRSSSFESDDPLNELRRLLAQYKPVRIEGLPEFHGGAVGYISYDQVRFFEKLPDANPDSLDLPDLYFMITDTLVIFDHVNNRIKLVSNAHVQGDPKPAYNEALRKIGLLEQRLKKPLVVTSERVRGAARQRIHLRRRHLSGGAVAAVRAGGSCPSREHLPRIALHQPVPLHAPCPVPGGLACGLQPGSDDSGQERPMHGAAHRRHAPARRERRGGLGVRERVAGGQEGTGGAHHARGPGPE